MMKDVLVILCLILSVSYGVVLVDLLESVTRGYQHLPFGFGLAAGILLFSKRLRTLFVWLHEHVHSIFSLLTFQGVREVYVSRHNGGFVCTENGSNILISLSPYSIPAFPILVLLLRYVTLPAFHPPIDVFAGFLYGQHLISAFRDSRISQPDIRKHGLAVSLALIVCMNIVMLSIVILLLRSSGVHDFIALFAAGVHNILRVFSTVAAYL